MPQVPPTRWVTFSFFFFEEEVLYFILATHHVGSYFPDQGWNPCPLQWKGGVLTTSLPGKSLDGPLLCGPVSLVPNLGLSAWQAQGKLVGGE